MTPDTAILVQVGTSLLELIAKQTVGSVTTRIKAIKDEKEVAKVRSTYDEIVNELLAERDEALRIAQTYKAEVDRLEISDSDIEHLHGTVTKVLELLKITSPQLDLEMFEQTRSLISVDALKTMQLLGFNYKAAIGEPLTAVCAGKITAWGGKQPQAQRQQPTAAKGSQSRR
jgi:hypothetical protein